MFSRLATLARRRPRRVLLVTLLVVGVSVVFGAPVAGKLSDSGSNFEDAGAESVAVREQLERAGGATPGVDLIALVRPPARAADVERTIRSHPAVARVVTAENGRGAAYVAASFEPGGESAASDAANELDDRLRNQPGVTVGGPLIAQEQVGEQVGKDLARAEMYAFPILFVLSLFIFRGLVAALLPLLAGLISIVTTFLALRAVNEVTPLSIFALNLVTGLGLGLAIDYSLFIVSRYREELARVGPGRAALARTLATAGRTVAYSSVTVAIALASLLVFPQAFLYSMGVGGIFVALVSAATALLVLPAVLALLGPRVNALSLPVWRRSVERSALPEQRGFWYRLARAVMRRPLPIATATAALLILLGVPFLGIKWTGVDSTVLPATHSARQVGDALRTEFPSDRTSPVLVAVEAPASARPQVEALAERLRRLPGAAAVSAPRPLSGLWQIDVVSDARALEGSSQRLVHEIRDLEAPFDVRVGGQTAEFVDLQGSLGKWLPVAIGILAFGTLLVLFAMTGSVVLPFKALVMNLLTVSAAFGILVLIFQDGRLEGVLDFTSQGGLESTQPILIFAVAFALSTDYAVFLLTRIKEARDAGLSDTEAVAAGLERTGRIVTAAALLFCIAIGAFSTSEIVFIKEIGVGTALAVLIDATLVRALLVPSLMALLGRWNWWAPGPLRRLHRRLGIAGEAG